MDILPGGISEEFHIFRELQDIHDTGYFSSHSSIEDQWQQVIKQTFYKILNFFGFCNKHNLNLLH